IESIESRPPTKDDFLNLCRSLNNKGAEYIVIGGMAIIQHGYLRATEDIDLLVNTTQENEKKLIDALLYLPDKAASEIKEGDIEKYTVIRVADEIIIDLMKSACGIDYQQAKFSVVTITIEGVEIPFASLELLWKMKQTVREKDKLDLIFLREKLKKKNK
ncbi:MAG: nucleotidyltransferase, partial [Verrucomicrobia bacterium]|nr:nucleotidyltransferase [Verrucomicrobiota bacterium]